MNASNTTYLANLQLTFKKAPVIPITIPTVTPATISTPKLSITNSINLLSSYLSTYHALSSTKLYTQELKQHKFFLLCRNEHQAHSPLCV